MAFFSPFFFQVAEPFQICETQQPPVSKGLFLLLWLGWRFSSQHWENTAVGLGGFLTLNQRCNWIISMHQGLWICGYTDGLSVQPVQSENWIRAKWGTDVVLQPVFPWTVISECKLYSVSRWTNNMSMFLFGGFLGSQQLTWVVLCLLMSTKWEWMMLRSAWGLLLITHFLLFWILKEGLQTQSFSQISAFGDKKEKLSQKQTNSKTKKPLQWWTDAENRSHAGVMWAVPRLDAVRTLVIKHTWTAYEPHHVKQWLHW